MSGGRSVRWAVLVSVLLLLVVNGCGPAGAESGADGVAQTGVRSGMPRLVFMGDSITAGYGLDPDLAYPALLEQRIAAAGWSWRVVNAGTSGHTTSDGLGVLDWLLRQPVDVLVLALGGNDGLRGVPAAETERNLDEIVRRVRAADSGTAIVLAGMQAVPNMGYQYRAEFEAVFGAVAERHGLPFVPFLLDGVGGVCAMNQADGIHPTAQGQERVAEVVWEVLEGVLEERCGGA